MGVAGTVVMVGVGRAAGREAGATALETTAAVARAEGERVEVVTVVVATAAEVTAAAKAERAGAWAASVLRHTSATERLPAEQETNLLGL